MVRKIRHSCSKYKSKNIEWISKGSYFKLLESEFKKLIETRVVWSTSKYSVSNRMSACTSVFPADHLIYACFVLNSAYICFHKLYSLYLFFFLFKLINIHCNLTILIGPAAYKINKISIMHRSIIFIYFG
jgi:hypothetical protein